MRDLKKCFHFSSGYTLIELIIVIALMTVLSGVVIKILDPTTMINRGRDSNRLQELSSLKSALELYFADNNKYPSVAQGLAVLGVPAEAYTDPSGGFYAYCPYSTDQRYEVCAHMQVTPSLDTSCAAGVQTGCVGYNCCLSSPAL